MIIAMTAAIKQRFFLIELNIDVINVDIEYIPPVISPNAIESTFQSDQRTPGDGEVFPKTKTSKENLKNSSSTNKQTCNNLNSLYNMLLSIIQIQNHQLNKSNIPHNLHKQRM